MRSAIQLAALALVACCISFIPPARAQNNLTFAMVPSDGIQSCVAQAKGRVTISTLSGLVENMHVEFTGLPAATDFAFFVIQQPTSKFGLAWYMGDMVTDSKGVAVSDFVGRFNIGTFIVAPGAVAAPVTLPGDANINPATPPVQLYHLGLWFDSPTDAGKAGCATTVTPFNSTHHGGVQVMNTSNFPALKGPLLRAP